jgi:antitoxin component YwqK of YwqJK toxin-antitoxin module
MSSDTLAGMRARLLRKYRLPSMLASASLLLLGAAGPARAGNQSENAQRRVEEDLLPKITFACGLPLSMTFDGESLRRDNKDIGYDQTDGANECDEPLRYIWYACQTDAGRAAVKAARIAKVVCKGLPGGTGSLTLSQGTITVGRAFEERQPFLRSRQQFESLLKITLKLPAADPYHDQDWHELAQQPNPVTSTTTYCLVNGDKVAFDQNVFDPFCRRAQDANVKCWKDGQVVIDLKIDKGKKTGFLTQLHDHGSRRVGYRDDKPHGEERIIEDGKLKSLASYEAGQRVWMKELFPSGKLRSYSHKVADGLGEITLHEDGKVFRLRCAPGLRNDKELRKWCGFEGGATTTSIYDGTGKVSRVDTWKDGVLEKQGAGDSRYAQRSEVAFKDGQKQGPERVRRQDGTLASSIIWDRGVKDGQELSYADDGKKIVEEILWKAGAMKQLTDFYLNGNPQLKESYDSPTRKHAQGFWDTGKISQEGELAICDTDVYGYHYRDWCAEGVHRAYFEDGKPAEETSFRRGQRQGTSKTWWENGRPASVEEYRDDTLTKAKCWDKDGKLLSDDEFEADGSRRIRH